MNKPLAWKQYIKPLERRLAHLVSKKTSNSFDKQEASALRHVLEIVSQPQRQWVGLTDEEMKKTWYEMQNIMGWYSFQEIAKAIEAKLKEKNT